MIRLLLFLLLSPIAHTETLNIRCNNGDNYIVYHLDKSEKIAWFDGLDENNEIDVTNKDDPYNIWIWTDDRIIWGEGESIEDEFRSTYLDFVSIGGSIFLPNVLEVHGWIISDQDTGGFRIRPQISQRQNCRYVP